MERIGSFAAACFVVLGMPGPSNTLLLTAAASAGARRAIHLVLAELGGYVASVTLYREFVGPLLTHAPLVMYWLRLAIGSYLLLSARRLWRSGDDLLGQKRDVIRWRDVLLTTFLNPKALLFALILMPSNASPIFFVTFGAEVLTAGTLWILAGEGVGRIALRGGGRHLIPKVGASALAVVAMLVLAGGLASR